MWSSDSASSRAKSAGAGDPSAQPVVARAELDRLTGAGWGCPVWRARPWSRSPGRTGSAASPSTRTTPRCLEPVPQPQVAPRDEPRRGVVADDLGPVLAALVRARSGSGEVGLAARVGGDVLLTADDVDLAGQGGGHDRGTEVADGALRGVQRGPGRPAATRGRRERENLPPRAPPAGADPSTIEAVVAVDSHMTGPCIRPDESCGGLPTSSRPPGPGGSVAGVIGGIPLRAARDALTLTGLDSEQATNRRGKNPCTEDWGPRSRRPWRPPRC